MKWLIIFLTMSWASLCHAQWSHDPTINTRVTNGGLLPQIISDGNGGAYIVYQDSPALLRQLWVQRLDRYGYVRFSNNGIRVSSSNRNQTPTYFLVSDNVGGVIVVFHDFRPIGNNTIEAVYAQRIDSSGIKLWGDAGVEVSPPTDDKAPVSACSDGEKGVFVFWGENFRNRVFDLRSQWISATGKLMWPGNGILITDEFTSYSDPIPASAISDGKKGVIVLYSDSTGTRLQRINQQGSFLWQNGIKIFPVGRQMIDDAQGGAIIAGERFVLGNSGYYFTAGAQRINASGQILWGPQGISIVDTVTDNTNLYLAKDYTGGVVFGLNIFDIKTAARKWLSKRVSGAGNVLWENHKIGGVVITDPKGNSIFETYAQVSNSSFDFFVHRLDTAGRLLWNSPVLFSKTGGDAMIDDSQGGVINIWAEIGSNTRFGIFAQQVSRNGNLGEVLITSISEPGIFSTPTKYVLHQSFPNPFNASMLIPYEIPKHSFVQLKIFDVSGKEVIKLINQEQASGKYTIVWNGKDEKGGDLTSGLYFYQLQAGSFIKTRKALFMK